MTNEENGQLLSPKEAGKYMQVSHITIRRLIKNGFLQGFKIGKNIRVRLSDIEKYIETTKI